MSAIAAILQRAKDVAKNGDRLEYVGLPPEEWKALLAELRQVSRFDRGRRPNLDGTWEPAPWELPNPDRVTLHSVHGPVDVSEAPPLVLTVPSYSATLTGIT